MHDKFEKERPYEIVSTITNEALDVPRNNYEGWDEREVPITDVRGDESLYQLDTHGFTYRPMRHDFSDFYDKHKVETEFIPKVVEPFLKANVEGWDKIHLFDWRLRRNDPAKVPPLQYFKDGTKPWLPAKKAHVDQGPSGVVRRVRHHLKDEANQLLKGRVRLIIFWKPIFHSVIDSPLAVCDGSTVASKDCIVGDVVRRDFIGNLLWVLPNAFHKWYYLGKQRPDEVLLMKMFDSALETNAKCCPHAAFSMTPTGGDIRPRESIEVRYLVFRRTEAALSNDYFP